jgi:predicted PurR-regulated permease PerM
MLKTIKHILVVLLVGFIGGAISFWFMGWLKAVQVPSPSDAISIANTYIVFTTIIFVGVTVILAIAGYVFTQQFSASKQSQETLLVEELKEKIKSDERVGTKLAQAILDNPDVQRHLEKILLSKLDELLQARLADSKAAAAQSTKEAEAINNLSSQLKVNGG